jgi:hypothetical protein
MKRLTLAAGVALAVSVPAAAAAKPVTPQHAHQYTRLYHKVAVKMGRRAPGRNIVRWGFGPDKKATDAQVLVSIGVLERMLVPAPLVPPAVTPLVTPTANTPLNSPDTQVNSPATGVSDSGASAATTGASDATSGSSLPACTWQPESGGNPSAVNPSSGAGGYYQIMPSTWSAYGGSGSPQDAPMSEQTAVAQKIYQSQGPGAWTNC